MSKYSVVMNPKRILKKEETKMTVWLTQKNLIKFKSTEILHFKLHHKYEVMNMYTPLGDWKLVKQYKSEKLNQKGCSYTKCILQKEEVV